ncbi:GtrA family protein [Acidipropionibacterium virtanenii]|uniref:GtrA/DPMS transmembrane domain-containing protein n=1 Tax=Acidipropionibacterium virtanenii TaxID=2057246 RepID=A0A344UPW1_9ACTN|nr:GtrA family protein [Acidipropionibacterium virtanenii]AXE37309.1 hypothetical protein JS278_00112 [Acidipropionibacterium virtanenii]
MTLTHAAPAPPAPNHSARQAGPRHAAGGRPRRAAEEVPGSGRTSPGGLFGQLLSFGVVGVISTIAYYVIYVLLRLVMGAQLSNLLALLITQVWNTAANRRHTFGLQTREGMLKHQASGMIAFVVGLGLSSGMLWLLHHYSDPARRAEVLVLLAANGIATLVRFVTLRLVIGHDEKAAARA